MAKKIIGKLPLAAVLVGFALSSAGCATIATVKEAIDDFLNGGGKNVVTETSKTLLAGANDILTGNPDGYPARQFQALFQKKFPGLTWDKNTEELVELTYKGAKYKLYVDNVPQQRGDKMFYWLYLV
jgi:hypothetical protein